MRVALLSRAAHPLHEPGGLERAVYHLALHLRAQGVETVLFTRPPTRAGSFPGEVVSIPYGGEKEPSVITPRLGRLLAHGSILDRTLRYPRFAARVGQAVASRVRAGDVDLVHAQGLTGLGYGRLRRGDPGLRAPLVVNPQGMEEHKTRGLKRQALSRLRGLSREAAGFADRVIATDESTRGEVPVYLGVDPARVVVIPNGIDVLEIERATPSDPARVAREALPELAGAHPVILSVGRVEGYKGFFDTWEALRSLHAEGRLPWGWLWVVVGDGPHRQELSRRVLYGDLAQRFRSGGSPASDLRRHVVMPGRVSEAVLHALYESADVFVHATRYEGSSLVTLEAMAHGLPVIATRAGGIPDKVVEGETGFLVEPGDVAALATRVAHVLADPDGRRAMGALGRTRARSLFAWPAIATRTIALYEQLLAAPAGRGAA